MAWKQLSFTFNTFWYADNRKLPLSYKEFTLVLHQSEYCVFVVLLVVHHRAADLRNPTPSASNSTNDSVLQTLAEQLVGHQPLWTQRACRLSRLHWVLSGNLCCSPSPTVMSENILAPLIRWQCCVITHQEKIAPHQKTLSWNSIISLSHASCKCF